MCDLSAFPRAEQVHEKIFGLKKEMNGMQDDIEQKDLDHTAEVRKLNNDITEKVENVERLTAELTDSQERNT